MSRDSRKLERTASIDPENRVLRRRLQDLTKRLHGKRRFALIAHSHGNAEALGLCLTKIQDANVPEIYHFGKLYSEATKADPGIQNLIHNYGVTCLESPEFQSESNKKAVRIFGSLLVHGTPSDPLNGVVDFSEFYSRRVSSSIQIFNSIHSNLFVAHPGWDGILTESINYLPAHQYQISFTKAAALPRWIVRVPALLAENNKGIRYLIVEQEKHGGTQVLFGFHKT